MRLLLGRQIPLSRIENRFEQSRELGVDIRYAQAIQKSSSLPPGRDYSRRSKNPEVMRKAGLRHANVEVAAGDLILAGKAFDDL